MVQGGIVEWINGGGGTAGPAEGGGGSWGGCGGHNGHSQLIINTLNEQQPRSRGSLWPGRRGHFQGDPKLTLVDVTGEEGASFGRVEPPLEEASVGWRDK